MRLRSHDMLILQRFSLPVPGLKPGAGRSGECRLHTWSLVAPSRSSACHGGEHAVMPVCGGVQAQYGALGHGKIAEHSGSAETLGAYSPPNLPLGPNLPRKPRARQPIHSLTVIFL